MIVILLFGPEWNLRRGPGGLEMPIAKHTADSSIRGIRRGGWDPRRSREQKRLYKEASRRREDQARGRELGNERREIGRPASP